MSYYFMVDTYIPEDGSGEYDDYIVQVKPIVEQYGEISCPYQYCG